MALRDDTKIMITSPAASLLHPRAAMLADLVKMSETLVADSISVVIGQNVSVIGRVYQMTDSIADAWVAVGSLSEGNKIVASFAESFLEALDIIVVADGG